MRYSFLKAPLAELFGTFGLALVVGTLMLNQGSSGYVGLYEPMGIAIAFGVLTYCLQGVSGANLNPAVSLGLWTAKQMSLRALAAYLVAQLLGAFCGIELARYFSGAEYLVPAAVTSRAEFGELIGTLILSFAVAKSVMGHVPAYAAGLITGGGLLVSLTVAKVASGGILNPALAVGLADWHVSYLVMPLLGGIAGVWLARYLSPIASAAQAPQ